MLLILFLACSGGNENPGSTDGKSAAEAFLGDYAALQCVRLAECDKHFDDHFDTLADCEDGLAGSLTDYEVCSIADADSDACLDELEQADCDAVLTNDLPACDVSIWSCP